MRFRMFASVVLLGFCASSSFAQGFPNPKQVSPQPITVNPKWNGLSTGIGDKLIYDNTTNFMSEGYASGGATVISGNDMTAMVADNVTVASGAGKEANSFSFSVANY